MLLECDIFQLTQNLVCNLHNSARFTRIFGIPSEVFILIFYFGLYLSVFVGVNESTFVLVQSLEHGLKILFMTFNQTEIITQCINLAWKICILNSFTKNTCPTEIQNQVSRNKKKESGFYPAMTCDVTYPYLPLVDVVEEGPEVVDVDLSSLGRVKHV